jgi:hypothetical protein
MSALPPKADIRWRGYGFKPSAGRAIALNVRLTQSDRVKIFLGTMSGKQMKRSRK